MQREYNMFTISKRLNQQLNNSLVIYLKHFILVHLLYTYFTEITAE